MNLELNTENTSRKTTLKYGDLKSTITQYIDLLEEGQIALAMKAHFHYFGLFIEGKPDNRLLGTSEINVLRDCSKEGLRTHWHRVLDIVAENEYLNGFFTGLSKEVLEEINDKIDAYSKKAMIMTLTYGFAMDKLGQIALENNAFYIRYNRFLFGKSNVFTKNIGVQDYVGFSRFLVEKPVRNTVLVFENQGKNLKPTFGRQSLAINIKLACLIERKRRFKHNALAGEMLAKHKVGKAKFDPVTGAGPSEMSASKNVILTRTHVTMQWVDLYTSWNMCFKTQMGTFLMAAQNLIIPSVNVDRTRRDFLYRFTSVLYWSYRYWDRRRADIPQEKDDCVHWTSPLLSGEWGKYNDAMAKDYDKYVTITRNKAYFHDFIS